MLHRTQKRTLKDKFTGPNWSFHKLVLHPKVLCIQAMSICTGPNWSFTSLYFIQIPVSGPWAYYFYAQIGVSHYERPVLNSKLFYTGPRTHDVLAQTGVSHQLKACTSSKIPFTGPNCSFTIFECTSSKIQYNSYFTFVGGGDALDITRLVSAFCFYWRNVAKNKF